jgi:hypothetical protein
MAHNLHLFIFVSLMAAQAFAAGFSYLYGWHPSDRDHAAALSGGATLRVLGFAK